MNTVTNAPIAALVFGEAFDLPQDLYIPPDALRVFLETFQGPLDLLLYLIKKQNIDILDIPIAKITGQYMQYIELMQELQLDLAGEYLLMAAMLAEIKSRLLLPKPKATEEGGDDPRAELVRRLQEYERFKKAAETLDELPRIDRDTVVAQASLAHIEFPHLKPEIHLNELMLAFRSVLERAQLYESHRVSQEVLSIRERMTIILSVVKADQFTPFVSLFTILEGRMGVVVTLIALLELVRQSALEIVQAQPYAPIYLRAKCSEVVLEQ